MRLSARATATRLSLFYVAIFSSVGVTLPFWPVWLQAQQLSASQIGILLGASYLVKIATTPLVGHMADRLGLRRGPIVALAAGALLAYCAFGLADGFWPLLAVTLVATSLFSGIMPLGDNLTLLKTREFGLDYGRVRLWGSIAFILIAIGAGQMLEWAAPAAILWMMLATLLLTLLACLSLPEADLVPAQAGARGISTLMRSPAFLLFLASAGMSQVSHMVYYGFGTLHWRAHGISDSVVGALWATGVIAEIFLFAFAGKWAGRAGPAALLALAGGAGLVRWTLLAATTELPLLFAAQLLHGATFGCAHLGAMAFILRAAPSGMSGRAQAVHSSVSAGLAPGLAMPFMGSLYEALGGLAYLPMAAISLTALLAALVLRRSWRGGALDATE